MKFPNTLDPNVYHAYNYNYGGAARKPRQSLDAMNLNWDSNLPESLVELSIKAISDNWGTIPVFSDMIVCENRCLLIDILDTETLALSELSNHIKDNALWKAMFKARWRNFTNSTHDKKWIEIYIERHLSEKLETMKPIEYNAEKMKQIIELCSPFVQDLKINHLVASVENNESTNDHIPFDIILTNLNELKSLSITYDCKSIGTLFYLGCTQITDNDLKKFVKGLSHCHELREFKFHSSKLESPMLKLIARALDKGTSLTTLALSNCRFGDIGLVDFIKVLTHDSLPNMKHLILTNNFISSEGAKLLANILRRRKIETIDLKLNPIGSEGATAILCIANIVELVNLNLSSCSFDEFVETSLIYVLGNNTTLRKLNLSINKLGEDLGRKIIDELKRNKILRELDVRNSEISHKTKSIIDAIILENRIKKNTIQQ